MSTSKVTVELPADLLARARNATGKGITATIRRGLDLVASTHAQDRLRALRGRVNLTLDLPALRRGRAPRTAQSSDCPQ